MNIQRRKGVRDVKTHAGTMKKVFLPHEVYMRISTLEMERVHRLREMEGARKRIKTIMDRLKEIDIEKNTLINQLKVKTEYQQGNTGVHTKMDGMCKDKKIHLLKY